MAFIFVRRFIYVENNSNIKLGGFYFAELLATQDAVSNNRNVPYYYPCASLERNKITQKYDIWFEKHFQKF